MTTPLPPDDELASAVVDGVASAEDMARAAADPALSARVDEIRSVRRAVSAALPASMAPSAAARERAISAALAAAPPHELPPSAPVELDRHRARRSWVPVAAAAAVVAIVGIGAVLVTKNNDGNDASTALEAPAATTLDGGESEQRDTSAGGADDAGGGATTVAAAATTVASGATTTAASATAAPEAADGTLPDLGELTDSGQLALAVESLAAAGQFTRSSTISADDELARGLPACATAPTTRPVARLTWLGEAALLLAVDGPPPRALVVTVADCHPLAEVPLP
jgi:hypothetical protein